ncbi:nucleotidyltransferase domain-containing protein [Streptosporangium sp. NPDC051022]|uniref:nucleotidyltransferase domain-containing protein n=1 Tax=Streptosporangium sp. NPDC051022 TaxID=3155752 RepID=UPI00342A8F01
MTSSRGIDPGREPWSLARRFANRLAGVLDGALRDVVVIGSASLGDWQASSDIDLVCTVERELDAQARDAVSPLHGNSRDEYGHTIDAMYVTSEGLAKGPEGIPSVVASIAGTLHAESTDGPLNWVTWLNIVQSGVSVPLTEDGVMTAVDPENSGIPIRGEILREGAVGFSRTNLDEYWRNRVNLSEQIYLQNRTDQPVPAFEIEWMSLGPARLLATVLTGRIVSKSEGGELAAGRFPEFGPHLERVLEARRGADTTRTWDHGDLERSLELARTCVRLGTD